MLSDYDLLKFLLHIYFEEKSSIPDELQDRLLKSKGFLPEIIVDKLPNKRYNCQIICEKEEDGLISTHVKSYREIGVL
ncbi:hypothetical protein LF887_05220 [Chryseobacterium sp. MEBOG06]|uniref:hypothetical protein n=1 Tax=Chryseobacterium sp. MEBOG06 TaxID=2879938 RepID=UPI001F351099|nr:hypothetical protein [Chryseobacterium sp. MEBOG06]UKB85031.1 hypothetical protein LF887_05220 [Chryseobacterium sp. MEBOG06]